jgi:hypothetical protein
MDSEQYAKAAELSPKLLAAEESVWKQWVNRFAAIKKLRVIAPFIPVERPRLSRAEYEQVLAHFIAEDHEGLLATVKRWPADVYESRNVITAVQDRLAKAPSAPLEQALGELLFQDRQYSRALDVFLRIRRPDLFQLLRAPAVFDAAKDKVLRLMRCDAEAALALMIDGERDRDELPIPVRDVVRQLEEDEEMLHRYLDRLFRKDPRAGSEFHQRQVLLYAKYEPERLLPFFQQSESYDLEASLAVCRERGLHREQVFLLRRMGNTREALSLILHTLKNVKEAVTFVEEHRDDQLWEELITYSLDSPQLLSDLLEHIGAQYDPLRLVRRIPDKMEVPHLKQRLCKILSDCALHVSLLQTSFSILQSDCVALSQRRARAARRAMLVGDGEACAVCGGEVFSSKAESVRVFFCRHVYHEACLQAQMANPRARPACIHSYCQQLNSQQLLRSASLRLSTSSPATAPAAAAAAAVPPISVAPQRPAARAAMTRGSSLSSSLLGAAPSPAAAAGAAHVATPSPPPPPPQPSASGTHSLPEASAVPQAPMQRSASLGQVTTAKKQPRPAAASSRAQR